MSADAADSTNPTTSPEPPAATTAATVTTAADAVNEVPAATAAVTKTKDDGIFHESISEDEREYYLRMYPTYNVVRDRKPHCTVCKQHIGTAPRMESNIKMHPILRVTHCNKCHDFYNSGEFSKGEDGSELYCRWCGQGGEVYCCSSCPFVFCKSCIVKNLSRSVILDIENNENWSCFSCQPKIIYPLRAMHWALMHFIEEQKREIESRDLNESEARALMYKDTSSCCRLAKAKTGHTSDSMDSIDSIASRRSYGSNNALKKSLKQSSISPTTASAAKRQKTANNEVVCTPDLLSMLEPDCQIVVPKKLSTLNTSSTPLSIASARNIQKLPTQNALKVASVQSNYNANKNNSGGAVAGGSMNKNSAPPPLVLRNTSIQMRPVTTPSNNNLLRRTVVGPRQSTPSGPNTPVYHVISGYRIDLNSASQQDTFRLPNGRMIQVKRQSQPSSSQQQISAVNPTSTWQQRSANSNSSSSSSATGTPMHPPPRQIHLNPSNNMGNVSIQQHASNTPYVATPQQTHLPQNHPQMVRYHNTMSGNNAIITPTNQNGAMQIHVTPGIAQQQLPAQSGRPLIMIRHEFPDTAIGCARKQLQEQVFSTMDVCQHLTGKVHTLTNSNAYKQAKNYLEVKELYIHLSYLLTYAIGRFKNLQDKCLNDMRQLGFNNDADSLENGQLAADKQASDDEDIEIIEPHQETINLDSDNDDENDNIPSTTIIKTAAAVSAMQIKLKTNADSTTTSAATPKAIIPAATSHLAHNDIEIEHDYINCLASILDVDITEGDQPVQIPAQKKQPRKKTTNKPNPTLLKQKEKQEVEKLQQMLRSDVKLKMNCVIELNKVEEEFPVAKKLLQQQQVKITASNAIDEQKSNAASNVESQDIADKLLPNSNESKETSNNELIDKISAKENTETNMKVSNEKKAATQLETVEKNTSEVLTNAETIAESEAEPDKQGTEATAIETDKFVETEKSSEMLTNTETIAKSALTEEKQDTETTAIETEKSIDENKLKEIADIEAEQKSLDLKENTQTVVETADTNTFDENAATDAEHPVVQQKKVAKNDAVQAEPTTVEIAENDTDVEMKNLNNTTSVNDLVTVEESITAATEIDNIIAASISNEDKTIAAEKQIVDDNEAAAAVLDAVVPYLENDDGEIANTLLDELPADVDAILNTAINDMENQNETVMVEAIEKMETDDLITDDAIAANANLAADSAVTAMDLDEMPNSAE